MRVPTIEDVVVRPLWNPEDPADQQVDLGDYRSAQACLQSQPRRYSSDHGVGVFVPFEGWLNKLWNPIPQVATPQQPIATDKPGIFYKVRLATDSQDFQFNQNAVEFRGWTGNFYWVRGQCFDVVGIRRVGSTNLAHVHTWQDEQGERFDEDKRPEKLILYLGGFAFFKYEDVFGGIRQVPMTPGIWQIKTPLNIRHVVALGEEAPMVFFEPRRTSFFSASGRTLGHPDDWAALKRKLQSTPALAP